MLGERSRGFFPYKLQRPLHLPTADALRETVRGEFPFLVSPSLDHKKNEPSF